MKNIKEIFENKYLSRRAEFITDYDFGSDDKNEEYFINFIKGFELTKDDWYNVLIIDLANYFVIISDKLRDKYMGYLFSKNHFLLKLMILDYFMGTYEYYNNPNFYIQIQKILNSRYDRVIVKNQAILVLILVSKQQHKRYTKILINNLKKSNDYTTHIRVLGTIIDHNLRNVFSYEDLQKIIKIAENKDLGRALKVKLLEFKDFIKA